MRRGGLAQQAGDTADPVAVGVAALMARHYGMVVVDQRLLGGEVDENRWILTDRGKQFLLKSTSGSAASSLQWQEPLLEHLARVDPHLPVPRLAAALDGTRIVEVPGGPEPMVVRLLTWLDGAMLADVENPSAELLWDLGAVAARLVAALDTFPADLMEHTHHWDVRQSRAAVDAGLPFIADDSGRACIDHLMREYDRVEPILATLRRCVVHQDLNDFNVLAGQDAAGRWRVTGILDFGDALHSILVAEVAVAGAYAMLRQPDPVGALCSVVSGFDSVIPLSDAELDVVFALASARLCVNVTTWTRRTSERDQPYGLDRMRHTWPTLRALAAVDPAYARGRVAAACKVGAPDPGQSYGS